MYLHKWMDRQNDKTNYQLGEYIYNEIPRKRKYPKYMKNVYNSVHVYKNDKDIQQRTHKWPRNM